MNTNASLIYDCDLFFPRKIAVVGMAVRIPGLSSAFHSSQLSAFWENLVCGRCSGVETLPKRADRVTIDYVLPEEVNNVLVFLTFCLFSPFSLT